MSHMQSQRRTWSRRPLHETSNDWRVTASSSGSNSGSPGEGSSEPSSVSSGLQTPPLSSPPVSTSSAENIESRRDSPISLPRSSWRSSVQPRPRSYDVKPGIIMFFPGEFKTGASSNSTLLRQQPWVNQAATNHFVTVWDTYMDGDEEIARCLPMTSFKETRVEEKYYSPNAWKYWLKYVPIMQGGVSMASEANMPSLALVDRQAMQRPTYVHLDHFFDIEVKFLSRRHPVYLENDALSVLVYKFHQFITKTAGRPRGGIRSPLDYGSDAPDERLARPRLGRIAREKVRHGYELEAARYREAGTHEWIGTEPLSPRRQAEQDQRARMY